jgi:hypothetical protein
MEPWKDQLRESFKSYVEYAALNLKRDPLKEREPDKQIYLARIDQASRLRSITENLEDSKEFSNLVSNFSIALGREAKKGGKERHALKNFFRRSGVYLGISEGKPLNVDEVFERLSSVFGTRTIKIINLRLIEEVYFPEAAIDFGGFGIQCFSKAELDELVDNRLNSVFYPHAQLDTGKLSHYWFIREEKYKRAVEKDLFLEDLGITWDELFRVSRTFPDMVMQLLTLFDWETKWIPETDDLKQDRGWLRFSTPIKLCMTDDIFETPYPCPNLSGLQFSPYYDALTGEEIGEAPSFLIDLEKEELERLRSIVIKVQGFVNNVDLGECGWGFLNIAMGYLAKAFTTDGLEQLLWHMTVLDALFGESNEVVGSLKRRLPNIFGRTEPEKKKIRKTIDELYTFRSDLVHGNVFKNEIFQGHLREARRIARNSLVWFLEFLTTIHEELTRANIPMKNYPKRKQFLFLLDSEKSDIERFKILIQSLPKDFPDHG